MLGVGAIVDNLAACQTGVAVKDFDGLRVTLHAPMVDRGFGHKCDSIKGNPLPKGNIIGHGVLLHFALHFNVENLKGFAS